jgi:hypothetical protein
MHRRHLAVHQLLRMDDAAAESLADRLMAEADAEQGNPAGKLANRRQRDACLCWRAGARRNDQEGRLEARSRHADGVVAEHPDFLSQFAKVLYEVVGKGVVIVDHEQHILCILLFLLSFNHKPHFCPGFDARYPAHWASQGHTQAGGLARPRGRHGSVRQPAYASADDREPQRTRKR